jgi:predicted dehydrogenase
MREVLMRTNGSKRRVDGSLSVAVVGCGYWGSKHVRVLHAIPQVGRVIAVDEQEDRLASLQKVFPALLGFSSMKPALREADAVIIATPPTTHVALALQAMAAGKNVLVEKPLATSSIDARRMVDEAGERSVVLMAGHTFEHNAAVWKLRELVRSNELGRIHYIDSARLNLGLYQSDVNVLWDLGPHDVSIFNHVLGAKPSVVEAWGSRHAHRHLEDVAHVRLLYLEPEVTGTIHLSWLDPCKVRRVTVVGSRKMAVYDDLALDERIRVHDKGVEIQEGANLQAQPMTYRYGEIRSPYLSFEEPLHVQDRDFVRCCIDGERPRTDGENGLAVVEVLEAASLSLLEGRPVYIEEVSELASPRPRLVGVP